MATKKRTQPQGNGNGSRTPAFLRERLDARRIQTNGDRQLAQSLDEAVVRTVKGRPDMRFAENRNKFMKDTHDKVTGEPDFRFVENRPDIRELHEERGDHKPNLIFDDDGNINV